MHLPCEMLSFIFVLLAFIWDRDYNFHFLQNRLEQRIVQGTKGHRDIASSQLNPQNFCKWLSVALCREYKRRQFSYTAMRSVRLLFIFQPALGGIPCLESGGLECWNICKAFVFLFLSAIRVIISGHISSFRNCQTIYSRIFFLIWHPDEQPLGLIDSSDPVKAALFARRQVSNTHPPKLVQ